ncbi:MAG: hypothetical protein IJ038_02245 [Clostridia bacterium]|nr:hypothetical protein [Clostridia bacterium]
MKIKKVLLLILALSMVASCFIGCNKEEEETGETTVSGSAATVATEEPYELPIIDLKDEVISVLVPAQKEWQFNPITSSLITETISQSVVTRNDYVESTYNCTFDYIVEAGNAERFTTLMSQELLTQDGTYDLVFTDYWWNLEIHGYFRNLKDYETVALNQPWFCQGWNDAAEIKGHLNGAVGYSSTQMMTDTAAIFFNETMYNSLFENSIYDYVYSGDWTMETLATMSAAAKVDDGNDGMNSASDDIFGITMSRHGLRSLFYTSDVTLFKISEDGTPKYDYNVPHNIDVFDDIQEFFALESLNYQVSYTDVEKAFSGGKALFAMHNLSSGLGYRASNVKYGVVPYPKYDINQENYVSNNQGCCYMAIPVTADDGETSAIIMNALNYYSYAFVKPAVLDTVLKLQVASNQDASNMVDICLNNIEMDFGFIYDNNLNSVSTGLADLIETNREYSSYYQSLELAVNTSLERLLKLYIDPNAA